MFDTAEKRGLVLALVVAVAVVGVAAVNFRDDRALDEAQDEIVDLARHDLLGVPTQEVIDLWFASTVDPGRGSAALDELLDLDGHEPTRVEQVGADGLLVTYRTEAGGRTGTVTVEWGEDGADIDVG